MVLIDIAQARMILNGKGEPTIEVELSLTDGQRITGSSPSGSSTSTYEALELVDKDYGKYFGRSVEHALRNVNDTIAPRLKKLPPQSQEKIDQILHELDSTPNFAHIGSNASLAVSIATARAGAASSGIPLYQHINDLFNKMEVKNRHDELFDLVGSMKQMQLPILSFNLIGGGGHANNNLKIQEFLIYPVGVSSIADQIRAGAEIRWQLGQLLAKKGHSLSVNSSGAFTPELDSDIEAFELLVEAVNKTNYHLKNGVLFGFDASGAKLPADFYESVLSNYPVLSVEDPYSEDDFESFTAMNQKYPDVFTIGDNITAVSVERLNQAIEHGSLDGVCIKPNQVGTVTEALKFARIAKFENIAITGSHRSGETNDSFIVDFSIGVGAKFLKIGAPVRGENVSKYNHLLNVAARFEEGVASATD